MPGLIADDDSIGNDSTKIDIYCISRRTISHLTAYLHISIEGLSSNDDLSLKMN